MAERQDCGYCGLPLDGEGQRPSVDWYRVHNGRCADALRAIFFDDERRAASLRPGINAVGWSRT